MRDPRTRKPPLPIGTHVDINISEGLSIAQGIIIDAEYDDAWAYRIDILSGDRCDMHRTADGELWVCDFEVTPTGGTNSATPPPPMPHTIEIVNDLLVVLDEDGNGCDCHELRSLRKAKRQLRRWQKQYTFDYADALSALSEFFASVE
jgi:hypothetical protein